MSLLKKQLHDAILLATLPVFLSTSNEYYDLYVILSVYSLELATPCMQLKSNC